jgi:plastocyanin
VSGLLAGVLDAWAASCPPYRAWRHIVVAPFIAALLWGPGGAAQAAAKAKPKPQVIVIEAMQFAPAELNVAVGDTIVWKNKDPFPHNVVAADKSFHSPDIASGGSWKFKAVKAGTFPYTCTLHSGMNATLVVAPAATAALVAIASYRHD